MMMNFGVNWEHLASTNDSSEREALSSDLFTDAADQFVRKTLALIDQEFYVLTTQARRLADGYWRFNKMMREDGGKENQGYYGTRVRAIGSSLSIVWYINTLYQDKSNPNGPMRIQSKHLKKGAGFKYSAASFRKAKEWEREAIEEVENQYAEIRKRAASLSKMRQALKAYATASGLSLTVDTTQVDDEGEEDAETTDAS